MNKLLIGIFMGVLVLGVVSAYLIVENNSPVKYDAVASNSPTLSNNVPQGGETQKITLSLKNGNYYPNTINLKKDVQAEIILDDSVVGCFRSFNVRDLGISKYSRQSSEPISFTPTKPGTYAFLCSMGMGRGTMIVT